MNICIYFNIKYIYNFIKIYYKIEANGEINILASIA